MVVAAIRPAPPRPAARANAPGRGRQRRRAPGGAQRVATLPNDINAPTARVSYYKLFSEFMNYKDNNAYEYGQLFSE